MKIFMPVPQVQQFPELSQLQPGNETGEDFVDILNQAVRKVDSMQKEADRLTIDYLTGNVDNIHQVLVVTERANLALQLTVQIRNKVVEAYQEISRMQI